MSNFRLSRFLWAVLFVCLLIGLKPGGLSAADSADSIRTARMEMPVTVVDLGNAEEGEVLNACFTMLNTGREVLCIHRIKSGCGCTSVDYPCEIAPSGQGRICLTIDTLGTYGLRKFKTAVYTNDPSLPSVIVQAKALINPMVTLTPDRVFFRGNAGKKMFQDIQIKTRGEKPLLVEIDSHNLEEKTQVTLESVIKGRQYLLKVENRVMKPGSFRGRILLRTDHPGRERIVVPVFAHLTPPVAAYPSRLILETGKCLSCRALGKYSGSFIVRAHDQAPLRILGVEPEKREGLTCGIETLVPDQAYRFKILYVAADDKPLPKELIVRTNRTDPISVPLSIKK